MSDDIASDVQRLTSILGRIPELVDHARLLKQSHEGLAAEISDIAGNSGFTRDMRGKIHFADKMIDDYTGWMRDISKDLSEFSTRIQQAAGMSGGPFG